MQTVPGEADFTSALVALGFVVVLLAVALRLLHRFVRENSFGLLWPVGLVVRAGKRWLGSGIRAVMHWMGERIRHW
jgi:hypothetical protein